MIYLFNSAARPEYVKNVLNTLHLPSGTINLYQYESKPHKYVKKSPYENMKGEKVVISFIDRNDIEPNKNKYIPLRFGILKNYLNNQGKSYFYVELGDFVSNEGNYDSELKSSYRKELFYKEKNTEHGYLAFVGKEVVSLQNNFSSRDGWINTVKRVEHCHALKENNCVYTHFEIVDNKRSPISPYNNEYYTEYRLKINGNYRVIIDYYVPFAEETPDADILTFEFDGSIDKCIEPTTDSWGAQQSFYEGTFHRLTTRKEFYINYQLKPSNKTKAIIFADTNIHVSVVKRNLVLRMFPYFIFFIVTFFSTLISTLITSLNIGVSEIQSDSSVFERIITWISGFNPNFLYIFLAIFAAAQAMILLWINKSKSKDE